MKITHFSELSISRFSTDVPKRSRFLEHFLNVLIAQISVAVINNGGIGKGIGGIGKGIKKNHIYVL